MSTQNFMTVTYRSPKLLQTILLPQLTRMIMRNLPSRSGGCRHALQRYEANQRPGSARELREVFQQLPASLRSEILQKALSSLDYSFRDETSLLLTQVLVSPEMIHLYFKSSLSVDIHLALLIQILIKRTKRLKILALPKVWIEDLMRKKIESLLINLLVQNNCLTHLQLPGTASDNVLRTIAKSCYQLRFLDVGFSKGVTDRGMFFLTQYYNRTEHTQCPSCTVCKEPQSYQASVVEKSILNGCCNAESNRSNRKTTSTSNAYHTLRIIHLHKTSVSVRGLSALLNHVDSLEDIDVPLDEVCDNLYVSWKKNRGGEFEFPNWNLSSVTIENLTRKRFKVLKAISTESLSRLNLSAHNDSELDFSSYIIEIGNNLTHLNVADFLAIELSIILKSCPHLESLEVHPYYGVYTKVESIFWGEDKNISKVPSLENVKLVGNVSAETAFLLLESATHLKECHFRRILGDENVLLSISEKSLSKDLITFTVKDENFFDNLKHLSKFWLRNQNIKTIGYTALKVSDLGLGDNIDLEFLLASDEVL